MTASFSTETFFNVRQIGILCSGDALMSFVTARMWSIVLNPHGPADFPLFLYLAFRQVPHESLVSVLNRTGGKLFSCSGRILSGPCAVRLFNELTAHRDSVEHGYRSIPSESRRRLPQ